MIEVFQLHDQEKTQFPAFLDTKLFMFLREQYDVLKKEFQRYNLDVDVCLFTFKSYFLIVY